MCLSVYTKRRKRKPSREKSKSDFQEIKKPRYEKGKLKLQTFISFSSFKYKNCLV